MFKQSIKRRISNEITLEFFQDESPQGVLESKLTMTVTPPSGGQPTTIAFDVEYTDISSLTQYFTCVERVI